MFSASKRTLKWLAAAIWIIGGIVLLLKANSLLTEAYALHVNALNIWLAAAGGVAFGGVKSFFLFRKSCRRNLTRIAELERPKIWQFYRLKFFFLLVVMITTGATLSRIAHGNYPFLLGVAILDLSIGVALLSSSVLYGEVAFRRITAVLFPNKQSSQI
ncbi:MAG: hypothetical protein DWQ04_05665 [Chloroflexi bacterium]|nr:MAG: hypothetical protein DWQ04_05665 [Chloroflexota bacterium]